MKRNVLLLAALFSLSLGGFSRTTLAQEKVTPLDESKEPKLEYLLKVGDKTFPLDEGAPLKLDGTFSNPEITLVVKPNRLFSFQGVSFRYPRTYVFEADLSDKAVKSWTVQGKTFSVMYFVFSEQVSTTEFAAHMLDGFGRDKSKMTNPDLKLTLGKETLAGVKLEASVSESKLTTEIYRIPSSDTTSKYLVFQEELDGSGGPNAERKQTMKELTASFNLSK
jgi:hypothetical protein